MNIILIAPRELDRHTVVLKDHRGVHIRKILRSKKGDTVRVGVLNGPVGSGRILEITASRVVLEVSAETPPPSPPLTDLILALPRPIMLKRVLAQAAQMGVGRIFLINANRVEKSFFSASLLKEENYQTPLQQGLEQAIDTRVPDVTIHKRFRPFVEDNLAAIVKDYPARLVAHPTAAHSLPQLVTSPLSGRALLAIGPEGGWVDFEVNSFQKQGLKPFSLGPRILRVDTAVPALLSQVDLLRQIHQDRQSPSG